MGGSSSSSTERSTTSYAPWIQEGQQDVAGAGFNMAEGLLYASPFARAALTADQRKAFDLARLSGRDAFETTVPQVSPSDISAGRATQVGNYAQGQTHQMAAPRDGQAQSYTANQVDGGQIQSMLSPYLQSVANSTLYNMRRERDRTASDIGARAAASGAFGGSREAVQRAQLDRNYGDQVASAMPALFDAGYNRGQSAAFQNMGARQSTDESNTGRRQQMEMANIDNAMKTSLANAQMRQQMEGMNLDNRARTALANQAAANQYGLANLDARMKSPQINSQLLDAQQRRELTAANAILQGGNQQQQFAQGNLDAPWVALAKLQGLIPQVYDSNRVTQKETETDAGIGGLLGGFGSLLGAVGRFSDEREKTDITKMGKDPKTGLDMYAYRYKGDPKSYPKVVGPMAQDIEKRMPEAVTEYGGKKVIDMGLLRNMQEKKR